MQTVASLAGPSWRLDRGLTVWQFVPVKMTTARKVVSTVDRTPAVRPSKAERFRPKSASALLWAERGLRSPGLPRHACPGHQQHRRNYCLPARKSTFYARSKRSCPPFAPPIGTAPALTAPEFQWWWLANWWTRTCPSLQSRPRSGVIVSVGGYHTTPVPTWLLLRGNHVGTVSERDRFRELA